MQTPQVIDAEAAALAVARKTATAAPAMPDAAPTVQVTTRAALAAAATKPMSAEQIAAVKAANAVDAPAKRGRRCRKEGPAPRKGDATGTVITSGAAPVASPAPTAPAAVPTAPAAVPAAPAGPAPLPYQPYAHLFSCRWNGDPSPDVVRVRHPVMKRRAPNTSTQRPGRTTRVSFSRG